MTMAGVKESWFAEVRDQAAVWPFVFRTVAACFLAIAAAMHFQLDQPGTAALTVLIVMQPHSGAVLAKSAFRTIGTLMGCAAVLVLFALVPQHRILLLLGLALWIGFCTAGAAYLRNFQSYGFVLAGYTACIVGFPATENPQAIFSIATARVSEVLLGILCSAVMVETAFSNRSQKDLLALTTHYFVQFGDFVQKTLTRRGAHDDVRQHYLRLVAGVSRLEMHATNAFFEAQESRLQYHALHAFTVTLMAASSSFRAFYYALERLRQAGRHSVVAAVDDVLVSLSAALHIDGKPAHTPGLALHLARRLHAERTRLDERLTAVCAERSLDTDERHDTDALIGLLRLFLHDMHACMLSYAALTSPRHATLLERMRFVPKTDPVTALVAGVRAVTALLVVSSFWIFSAWPNGATATTFTAVLCALFASSPAPIRAVWSMGKGALLGAVCAMVCIFFVLPRMDGFLLLCAGLLPFLMVGPWLSSSPATSPAMARVGGGYNIMLFSLVGPSLMMQSVPETVFNSLLARLFALGVAGVIFATLLPSGGAWWKHRLLSSVRHAGVRALFTRVPVAMERFESGVHDIVLQFVSNSSTSVPERGVMQDWAFLVSEIARVMIALRREMRYFPLSGALREAVEHSIDAMALLFAAPSAARHAAALASLDAAIRAFDHALHHHLGPKAKASVVRLRRMRAFLHMVRMTVRATTPLWERPPSAAFLSMEASHAT